MPVVYQHAAARRDLVEQFVYLAETAGVDTAERFLANAEASFNDLARQPLIGAPLTLRHPDLATMRKWRITNFENHRACAACGTRLVETVRARNLVEQPDTHEVRESGVGD